MSDSEPTSGITALTVQLLSAYLANNTVSADDLAGLIRSTRAALVVESAPAQESPEAPAYSPAVSVRKSLASTDYILSLLDGKPYKTLKRHLASNGLTPKEYRERYNLPATYPMVAPSFAARRREIAEKIGLGKRGVAAGSSDRSSPESADVIAEPSPSSESALGTVKRKPAAKAKSPTAPKRNQRKPALKTDAQHGVASSVAAPSAKSAKESAMKRAPISAKLPKGPKTGRVLSKSPAAAADALTVPAIEIAPNTAKSGGVAAKAEATAAASIEARKPAKAASGGNTSRKQPVKRMARTPKPEAKSADSRLSPDETVAAIEKPKRRRKLGLFGIEAADSITAADATAPAVAGAKQRRKRPAAKAK